MSDFIEPHKMEGWAPSEDYQYISDWFKDLSDDKLSEFIDLSEKMEDDDYAGMLITAHALSFYCRELDIDSIPRSEKKVVEIVCTFQTNLVIEEMRRAGAITTSGPIVMYKDYTIKATGDYNKYMETVNKNKKSHDDGFTEPYIKHKDVD